MRKTLVLALGLMLLAPGVWAQTASGSIYGTVTDESGAVLPGANVTISGATMGARSTTTGSQGDFRFLNLFPGLYKVQVALTGFTTVNREVRAQTGTNVDLVFNLKVATVEETVTVTAETPIVDTKKTGTQTNIGTDELYKVPQARDPWAVLRTVPGVIVDRVNVAGNESGQQAGFVAKGSNDDDTQWSIDGVVVTDMAAIGASPTYFDYDAFEEIQYSTGGNDVKLATGGIALNFVTKRGTNSFHGGGRYFLTHDDFQSSNLPDELESHTLPNGSPDNRLRRPGPDGFLNTSDDFFADKADHIRQISDYGADLGGPIVKDKLWFYGTYGVQDIRITRLIGTPDKTLLKSYNVKLNWQASQSDNVSAFWFWGRKVKEGRGVGSGLNEQDSLLWNQDDQRRDGTPPGLYKLEWNHIFSPNFFLNAKGGYYGTGFGLVPRGDPGEPVLLDWGGGVGSGPWIDYRTLRPQTVANVDGNYFKTAMGGNHEFKFGFGYRHVEVDSNSIYGGDARIVGNDFGGGVAYAQVFRDRVAKYESNYTSVYLSDTFTKDRLTLNLGLRYDHQTSNNVPSSADANPFIPDQLPALDFDGSGIGAQWDNISPRLGLTYALNESRKTVVRASYSKYASQISTGDGTYDNPIGSASYLAYFWNDSNGDRAVQTSEILLDQGVQYYGAIDPANPTATTSPNRIDEDYKAPTDHEFVAGIDQELAPNLAISAAYTWRKSNDISWQPRNDTLTSDYAQLAPVTRDTVLGSFTGIPFGRTKLVPGRIITNRPDRTYDFQGVEASIIKRLSNKWMGRVAVSWNDWTENFDGGVAGNAGVQSPTRTQAVTFGGGVNSGPLVDGGQVAVLSGGSGKGNVIYSSVKWQLTANALVQLGWDMELAGALFARQGNPRPTYITVSIPADGSTNVMAEALVDDRRYADIWNVDFRLAKNIKIGGATAVLSAELFNAFNSGTEIQRTRNAASSVFNRLDEILSPRVARFGLRFQF
jgi:hypothetical protein